MKTAFRFMTIALLAASTSWLWNCANKMVGSETGNTDVTGKLAYQDDSPADGVTLYLRPSGYAPDVTGLNKRAKALGTTDSIFTNSDGTFGFDSVEAGKYVVYGADANGNAVLIQFQIITEGQDLGTHTMKPFGSLKGKVVLTEGGDPRKVPVVLLGVNRWAFPDTFGEFKVDSLAEGAYTLRLMPQLDVYDVLDKDTVVYSTETTDVGALTPKYNDLPTPKNLTATFEQQRQIVTLTWDLPDTTKVVEYVISRNSNDIHYNKGYGGIPAGSTIFCDTVVAPNNTLLEYRIVSKDAAGNASRLFDYPFDTITVSSALTLERTIVDGDSTNDWYYMTVCENGNLVVARDSTVNIYDSLGSLLTSWTVINMGKEGSVCALTCDPQGYIYTLQHFYPFSDTTVVKQFDLNGNLLKSWQYAQIIPCSARLYFFNGNVYTHYRKNDISKILVFDGAGTMDSLHIALDVDFDLVGLLPNGTFVFTSYKDTIAYVGQDGSMQKFWTIPRGLDMVSLGSVAVSKTGKLFIAGYYADQIAVFDSSGDFLAKASLQDFGHRLYSRGLWVDGNGKPWVLTSNTEYICWLRRYSFLIQ